MKTLKKFIQVRNSPTWESLGLLILRVGFGSMLMLGHGWGKLSTFSERSASFSDPLGVGTVTSLGMVVFAEFFCALLIVLGLATRLASVPLVITMVVAAFLVHADDPFGKKELALVYLTAFTTLAFVGPGRLSADFFLEKRL